MNYKPQLDEFFNRARLRLEAGGKEYGNRSFSKSLPSLLEEIEEELLDIAGWGFVAYVRLAQIKDAVARTESAAATLLASAEKVSEQCAANKPQVETT